MKLKVGYGMRESGFALPTILLVATVMLIVLVASIAAAAASRVSLDSQYYNQLAQQAAQSGVARVNECLKGSGYSPQWSTSAANKSLRPDSDCTGATMTGPSVSAYVVGTGGVSPSKVRTKYNVEAPSGTGIGSVLQIVGITELVRSSEPYNIWRTYEQSLYVRIEPPSKISCPGGFVAVPGDSRFNTNDFCVSKYEAKNVGGQAVSQAAGLPWVSINQTNAIAAAESACTGCKLISEAQWLTIAHNTASVTSNWSGGSVGSGYMYSGHNDNSPAAALSANTDDNDGYFKTGNTTGNQRRTLTLNNGEVIWDFSGNVFEWTTGQISNGKPGASGGAYRDWNAVAGTGNPITPNPFPVFGMPAASSWTGAAQGIGRIWSNSDDAALRAFRRGGSWDYGIHSGVFNLSLDAPPTFADARIGFRIALDPLSSIRCPEGHIPVPGNNAFGTKNFCVGKYEAKNVGGVARSEAAGLPWVNISQDDAKIAANNACGTCRLIGEAEWLTVAHNILNVPSNWTGNALGSGTIYRGHSDNSPASAQAASPDDSSGFFGTGNASGNQRRTLTLNNGEVIWDFSGNVWEWTAGQISGAQPGDGTATWAWREFKDASMGSANVDPSPFPKFGTPDASAWGFTHGLGKLYSSSTYTSLRAFLRSGNWGDVNGYGIFSLALNRANNTAHADAGFRTVSDPLPAVSCSAGMIPVPGDIRFGTTDFCVGKYEAKDVGGVATSQAAGLPWTSVTQNNAVTLANAACAKCRLIGEAEWLTIAHNVASVPSNWSGGSVGSGYIFRGHSDNTPTAALEASTNDSDGYFGTGNVSGDQRRTLTLTNGEVIWDFAGNIYEATSAQMGAGKPGGSGLTWREWNTVTDTGTLSPNPFPAFGTPAASGWTISQGIGRLYSNSDDLTVRGFLRGGARHNGTSSGPFTLVISAAPTAADATMGFRVVEVK